MTFRTLFEMMGAFIKVHPDHEALDQPVVVRLQTNEDNGDDLHAGGLRGASVDAGCTETFVLVLDASQEPDDEELPSKDDDAAEEDSRAGCRDDG